MIVSEFKDHGLAFVEDDTDEDGNFAPVVDHVTAEQMLLEKLMQL